MIPCDKNKNTPVTVRKSLPNEEGKLSLIHIARKKVDKGELAFLWELVCMVTDEDKLYKIDMNITEVLEVD